MSIGLMTLAAANWSGWRGIRDNLTGDSKWLMLRSIGIIAFAAALAAWYVEGTIRMAIVARRSTLPNYRRMLAAAITGSITSVRDIEKVLLELLLWTMVALKFFGGGDQAAFARWLTAFTVAVAAAKLLNACGVTGVEVFTFDTGWRKGRLIPRGLLIGAVITAGITFTADTTWRAGAIGLTWTLLIAAGVAVVTALTAVAVAVGVTFWELLQRYKVLAGRHGTPTALSSDPQH